MNDKKMGLWDRLNQATVTVIKTLLVIVLILGIPALLVAALYGGVLLVSMAWHSGAH